MRFLKSFGLDALVLSFVTACAVVGCSPSDGSEEFAAGWAAYDVRDLRKADQLFDKAVRLSNGSTDSLMAAARVKLELGALPESRALQKRAAAQSAKDDDVVLLGAELSYYEKDYVAARKAYADYAADASRTNALRAQAYAGLAVVEMSQNDNERARIALLKAIRVDRRNAPARYHLGLVYRRLGFEEAALEQFEIYVRLSKVADPRMQNVQRTIIPDLKDILARKAAERPGIERRDAATSAALLAKAEAAMKKGNVKGARDEYAAALKADPLSFPAALGLAQAWEKSAKSSADRVRAFDCYQCACTLRPSSAKAFVSAGALAMSLGRHATAVTAYSRALAADPTGLVALDGLIRALRKVGGDSARLANDYQTYRAMLTPAKRK